MGISTFTSLQNLSFFAGYLRLAMIIVTVLTYWYPRCSNGRDSGREPLGALDSMGSSTARSSGELAAGEPEKHPCWLVMKPMCLKQSMDWFKGKIAGKPHIYWENLWFPVDFPLNQSIETIVNHPQNHCFYGWRENHQECGGLLLSFTHISL